MLILLTRVILIVVCLLKDDSADLKCQLHFAKEELAVMCKKLTKLVSESESMHEKLAKYHSAYGDIDPTQSPEGKRNSPRAREAEVKVHLKLVEEEAMLLSRRIVELEVENRGLRAEMSDLREKIGGGGEEEEENRDVAENNLSTSELSKDKKEKEKSMKTGCTQHKHGQDEEASKGKSVSFLCSQSQTEGLFTACHITREGPVGGEWDPSDSQESDSNKSLESELKGMTREDYKTLVALRDHSWILISAIQLLTTPSKNGHCSSPTCSPTDGHSKGKERTMSSPGPLNEALDLLRAMLLSFIGRLEMLLTDKLSPHQDGLVWDPYTFSSLFGEHVDLNSRDIKESTSTQECVEDLCTVEAKQRAKQAAQGSSFHWDLIYSCRDPKMQLSLKILWILHQWCQVKGPELEGKEVLEV